MYYRISRSGADEPNVELLEPFIVLAADVPESTREHLEPPEEALRSLGFDAPSWCVFDDDVNGGTGCLAAFRHESGRALARLWQRSYRGSEDSGQPIVVTFISPLDDGSFFVSTASLSDTATPPGMEINQLVGASLPELWESHWRKLETDATGRALAVTNPQDAWAILEEHHRLVCDFYLQHGVFEIPNAESTLTPLDTAQQADTSPYASVLHEIERIQGKKPGWGNAILILGVSLLVFFYAGAEFWSWRLVLIIVPVLLFHEIGHYIAMRVFGYRDLRMFFIPLFGAAVSGRHYNVAGWKKATVSLAGPVPGIVLGIGLGVLALVAEQPWLFEASFMMLVLNGFNLLPFLPLDGGWVAHAILFSRHEFLDAGFRILAAVVLILGGLAIGTRLLPLVGLFMLFGVPMAFRVARVAAGVRRRGLDTAAEGDRIPTETACQIIDELQGVMPKGLREKHIAQLTLQVFETANAHPPRWLATLAFGAVYVISFLLALISPVILMLAQQGRLADILNPTVGKPQYDLGVEEIHSLGPPDGELSAGDVDATVIATFPTREAASRAFDKVAGELSGPCRLKLVGQTVILDLPAGTDEARELYVGQLESQDADVFVSTEQFDTWFSLECDAPNEQVAEEVRTEAHQYLGMPWNMCLIPPWSPEMTLTDEHRKARRTYQRLLQGPNLDDDHRIQQLRQEMGHTGTTSDQQKAGSLRKQYQERVDELTRQFYQQLRESGEGQVDVTLLDLYSRRPVYDSPAEALGADSKKAIQEYTEALEQWSLAAGARLGQLPIADGKPKPGADRYSCAGYATRDGLKLQFSQLMFRRMHDGPQALLEWLHDIGCAGFRYGFDGDRP
jgi:Zn-dependent protease